MRLARPIADADAEADLAALPAIDRAMYADWHELVDVPGGMGRIFRARDRRLGRHVAIKQLAARFGEPGLRAALARRFEAEARLTARLQHPAIVGVHEAGVFGDGELFYAMPLVDGTPLGEAIAQRPTLAGRLGLLPHLTIVADAVAYAHEQGVLHRDLKPDNIMVGAHGETVLVDWGLAKALASTIAEPAPTGMYRDAAGDGMTQLGVGTPQYMPPEQARGEPPDARFDVYALGATMYHALAGVPPYGAGDPADVRRALLAGPPRPLIELARDAPVELLDIVSRAMARDPATRFASARELAEELRRFQTGQLLRSRRYSPAELVRHYARRHRTALRVAAVALLALAALATIGVVRIARERDRAEHERARAELERGRAEVELRRAQGVIASQLARQPPRRLEAIALGIHAVAPELAAGRAPTDEALQGLLDALTLGPAFAALPHDGVISGFARSPDGAILAGVSDARALLLWDARTGALRARVATALELPTSARWAPDGARLVVCGFEARAEVFAPDGTTARLVDEGALIARCDFLPDGGLLTAADDLVVRDPGSLAVIARFELPTPASSAAVSARGEVVAACLDGSLWRWDPATGRGARLRAARAGADAVAAGAVAFDATGALVAVTDRDGRVTAWALATDVPATHVTSIERVTLGRALFAPTGDGLAVGTFDVNDPTARGTRVAAVGRPGPAAQVPGALLTWARAPDGLVTDTGGTLLIAARTGGVIVRLAGALDEATDALWLDDALASSSRDGGAHLWDLRPGGASGLLLGHTAELTAAQLDPGGTRLLTAALDGGARIWALPDGRELARVADGGEILVAGWLDARRVVIADLDGVVRIVDATSGHELARVAASAPIAALAITLDGGQLAIGGLDGTLALRDPSLATARSLRHDGGAVTAVAFAPDGARLVSAHADGSTRLWDVASGAALAVLADTEPVDDASHDGHVAISFTADGRRVLLGRPDGHTLIADATTLALRGRLDGRPVGPADGRQLITAAPGGEVLVHDLETGAVRHLRGHTRPVLCAAVSADGTRVATAGMDGTARIWDLATGATVLRIDDAGLGAITAVVLAGDALVVGHERGALRLHPATAAAALTRACGVMHRYGRDAEVAAACTGTARDRGGR